jgi:hypothetical protein
MAASRLDATEEDVQQYFQLFWPSGEVPICNQTGLPDRIVESRLFETVFKLWEANAHWKEANSFDRKLLRKFRQGGVIRWTEADWTVCLFVRVCAKLPIKPLGWHTLKHLVVFLCQHGRLIQPWGGRIVRWLNLQIPKVSVKLNVAPAA